MLVSLNNIEPVINGVLNRRRGYTLFSLQTPASPFLHAYSYRNDNTSQRNVIWTEADGVLITDEAGNTTVPNLFTPSPGSFVPRAVLSTDFAFFADGVQADAIKWNGNTSGSTQNWGINVNNIASLVFGPFNTGTGANVGTGTAWANPSAITGMCDGVFATVAATVGTNSAYLYGSHYGISGLTGLPIAGIQLSLTYFANGGLPFGGGVAVYLTINGITPAGSPKNLTRMTSSGTVVLGGPTDLWGNSILTAAQVQSSTFGILLQATNAHGSTVTVGVDCAQLTVYPAPGTLAVGTPGTGAINLLNGRTYFYAFQNGNTITTSSLSLPSLTTGPVTLANIPLSDIPTSLDPQVTNVLILATADGNDETTLYIVASLPNGTGTYIDNTPDAIYAGYNGPTLLTNPIYQDTDSSGILHGIADNFPPPAGLNYPIKHKGRIYGAIGGTLWFSKSLAEVTTANGLITSKYEEAWPATNTFDISEAAETIVGLLTDGETLWIGTERSIHRLIGDSPDNFQLPEIQFNETGLFSQDIWEITFYEGQPVGTIWMTPDFRVMGSDFNTYLDIGHPIQDILNTVNPAGYCHASFVSKGPSDYYMLYLSTGAATLPNTLCVFDLRAQQWFIWAPTDNVTASLFLIDGSGLPRWLFAAQAGPLYEWTYNTFQDRIGNTPVTYPATIQTSWLDFGDYTLRKFVNQIIPSTLDTNLTIQVDGATAQGDFTSPQSVVPATTVIPAAVPDDVFVPLATGSSHHRFFRFTIVSPPSTVSTVLGAYNVEAGVVHRY